MFRVGQKVVFIGPDFRGNPFIVHHGLKVPVPQSVYTIRAYAPRIAHSGFSGNGYLLVEVVNEPHNWPPDGFCETAINAEWLRPLVEEKTDIGFAHEILRKATKKERA